MGDGHDKADKRQIERGVNAISMYIQRLEDKIEEMFTKWVEENGYESIEDIRKDKRIYQDKLWEIINWKRIAGMCDNVNIATLNTGNAGVQLDARNKHITYLKQTAKIRIDVFGYLEDHIFVDSDD